MNILGLSGALGHDPASALLIDGELVAAAEEERFTRDKHAKKALPLHATTWCLQQAGLSTKDIHCVALPFAPIGLFNGRLQYAMRHWYAPDRALDALFMGNRRYRRYKQQICQFLENLGFDLDKVKLVPVEHHLAHASSAYHFSGFAERTAIIGIDGKGEYATTFFGVGEGGKIHKRKEFYDPDSLGGVYGALTEYLGFDMLDGEFKVMGMAPYGDAKKYDLSPLIRYDDNQFIINTRLVNTLGLRRYKKNNKGYFFSPRLIDWLGPMREGDDIDEPYVHYAASIQGLLERVVLKMVDTYLGDIIQETGKVCYAGGVALNVKLNQKIVALPNVKELFVQPAANDAGTAVGAASFVANEQSDTVQPLQHMYLGPSYTDEQCLQAIKSFDKTVDYTIVDDAVEIAVQLLAKGFPVAWFQGRMEFGPRALGNRSILGHPAVRGMADTINSQIKYRERWRPFCPSMLDSVVEQILGTQHPAPYMTISFPVAQGWHDKIPEVVHEDGTARVQVVTQRSNERYYQLIRRLADFGGHGVVLNTSLNRRGEPMVCSPSDALNMFYGCDLQYLVMQNILITK